MTSTVEHRKPTLPPCRHLPLPVTPPDDPPILPQYWFDPSRTRLAEKTCEMICYLWFATAAPEHSYPTPTSSPRPNPATTTLQLVATPTFVQFMQKLLETTQVSQSVIVLSLHYIYRLKVRNSFTPAQPGSEFRIAVAALMMANKFLDDNTYTNKTWSEVSGIDLAEINRMEKEFLLGVHFNLYVDKSTYESWLNLLRGLVHAKERDSRHFRNARSAVRAAKHALVHASAGPSSRTYSSRPRNHRARSTSPRRATFSCPRLHDPASPSPRSGAKRSADAAFSPSTLHARLPCKRQMPAGLQLQLHIPEYSATTSAPHSHSPLDGLQSFETMSLQSPAQSQWSQQPRPETLVTPYEQRRTSVPQNLYFYTLACSPMDREEEGRARKARLRYHQPPPHARAYSQLYPHQYPYPYQYSYSQYHNHNQVVQSASTSPLCTYASHGHALPHFHEMQWTRPPASVPASVPAPVSASKGSPPVPAAQFANNGPPGVQFYPTPVQGSTPAVYAWSAQRRRGC